jgi:hypothetical protein
MKTHILASLIIGGVLATSAARAEPTFSIRDLDVIYSGFNPSFTRDLDVSNYFKPPVTPKKVATSSNKSTCHWTAVKNSAISINDADPEKNSVESNYLAAHNLQLVC